MKGYILMSRTLTSSSIWNKPPLYLKVWTYLLMNACYSDVGNLKRGQIKTSIPEIQEACAYYVGYRKVTPTYKEVRSVIDFLRNPDDGQTKGNMIVTTKVTHGFIATICNYEVYQDRKTYERQCESNTKDARKVEQGQNKKKEKEIHKEKEINIYDGLPEDLRTTLMDFEAMRKSIRKPITTDRARKLLLTKLDSLAGDDDGLKIKILEQSIMNSWQGVFPLNNQSTRASKNTNPFLDMLEKGDY